MKNKSLKVILLFSTLLIIASVCFTSCGILGIVADIGQSYSSSFDELETGETNGLLDSTDEIDDIVINGNGEESEAEQSDSEDETDPPENTSYNTDTDNDTDTDKEETPKQVTIIENNVTVEGTQSNVVYAAASGLRSAVSIVANFSSGNSSGSGVIYKLDAESGSAFIITNYHVVYYSGNIYYNQQGTISQDIDVYLYGMENEAYALPAYYVGGSASYDIAVLYVENSEILKNAAARGSAAAVTASDSDDLMAGQTAIAIGNAESYGIAVTSGVVSVVSEYIEMTPVGGTAAVELRVMRIDTAVNSGNSGGGLFNDKGQLIGIVNAKIAQSDVENIAYAIPSSVVCGVADNIIDHCHGTTETCVKRAMLGIVIQPVELSTSYDPNTAVIHIIEKIQIKGITEGSLADGKFAIDDIIKSVTIGDETVTVTRMYHLIDKMLDARAGDTVVFKVVGTNGVERTVTITITEECLADY